jgi:hypothetical protein
MYEDYAECVQPEYLTKRITLDEHFADSIERVQRGLLKREHIDSRRAALDAIAAEKGGEWWEWIQGNEPQMQSGGIALVRDGQILWAALGWIS